MLIALISLKFFHSFLIAKLPASMFSYKDHHSFAAHLKILLWSFKFPLTNFHFLLKAYFSCLQALRNYHSYQCLSQTTTFQIILISVFGFPFLRPVKANLKFLIHAITLEFHFLFEFLLSFCLERIDHILLFIRQVLPIWHVVLLIFALIYFEVSLFYSDSLFICK